MELIKDISAVLGLITTIFAIIAACSKKVRHWFGNLFGKYTKDLQETNKAQNEAIKKINEKLDNFEVILDAVKDEAKQSCRNTIKIIYYKYCRQKQIPLFERKTADATYSLYKEKFHANSYVDLLYGEIVKWPVCPDEKSIAED